MALENLQAATRIEAILNGDNIAPATRREYFLKRAANEIPKPGGVSDAGKVVTVNENGDGYALEEAGGGGGGALAVSVSLNQAQSALVCDKTAGEMYAADIVMLIFTEPTMKSVVFYSTMSEQNGYYFTVNADGNEMVFSAPTANDYPLFTV